MLIDRQTRQPSKPVWIRAVLLSSRDPAEGTDFSADDARRPRGVTRAAGRLAFDLQRAKLSQSPVRPPARQEALGTGPVICGHQQSRRPAEQRGAKQMGHLVTHWHETGVVLFPRVCECVFGAATGLAMRRSKTTCLLRFHVWSAAPYSHCMTQRDSAFYVLKIFSTLAAQKNDNPPHQNITTLDLQVSRALHLEPLRVIKTYIHARQFPAVNQIFNCFITIAALLLRSRVRFRKTFMLWLINSSQGIQVIAEKFQTCPEATHSCKVIE